MSDEETKVEGVETTEEVATPAEVEVEAPAEETTEEVAA
jgi:hypothetical protein